MSEEEKKFMFADLQHFSSEANATWATAEEDQEICFPKHFASRIGDNWMSCLGGSVVNEEDDEGLLSRFHPFDAYLSDPDLNLFDVDFVNKLCHDDEDETKRRIVFSMEEKEGVLRRKFKSQGPRRLKSALLRKFYLKKRLSST